MHIFSVYSLSTPTFEFEPFQSDRKQLRQPQQAIASYNQWLGICQVLSSYWPAICLVSFYLLSKPTFPFVPFPSDLRQLRQPQLVSGQLYTLNHHSFVNLGCMLNFRLLGYVEFGFLKRYLILVSHISKCSSSLGPSWESNQVQLGWQVGARARLTKKL